MILPDTSIWISYLRQDDPDLRDILTKYLKTEEVITVSGVFGELYQGAKSNREHQVLEIIWGNLPKADETDLFIEAGMLSGKQKLFAKGIGLVDCYILAACLREGHVLWTLDKKLSEAFDSLSK